MQFRIQDFIPELKEDRVILQYCFVNSNEMSFKDGIVEFDLCINYAVVLQRPAMLSSQRKQRLKKKASFDILLMCNTVQMIWYLIFSQWVLEIFPSFKDLSSSSFRSPFVYLWLVLLIQPKLSTLVQGAGT